MAPTVTFVLKSARSRASRRVPSAARKTRDPHLWLVPVAYAFSLVGTRYVALLRGINVGGNNVIRMADLRACFEANAFEDVTTYIQSGNVLFGSSESRVAEITDRIERMLSTAFGYTATVVVRSHAQMQAIAGGAPAHFGSEPNMYRYDVIFLMPPLTASEAIERIETREGVDEVHVGPEVLYFSRLTQRASQSRLTKLVSTPMYKRVTVRNWNTATKLLSLLEAG